MSLAILFHFLCTQHVSDINISIIRSLRLCFLISTFVFFFFLFLCGLEILCGWVWVVSVLQAEVACNYWCFTVKMEALRWLETSVTVLPVDTAQRTKKLESSSCVHRILTYELIFHGTRYDHCYLYCRCYTNRRSVQTREVRAINSF